MFAPSSIPSRTNPSSKTWPGAGGVLGRGLRGAPEAQPERGPAQGVDREDGGGVRDFAGRGGERRGDGRGGRRTGRRLGSGDRDRMRLSYAYIWGVPK
ncbi:UPF0426 protein, chloroplastic [Iris pallida]|uniref:UPF0426 protein, chloroplastic n=1 Tax=Iris pallida TaxID=29817 RepID=A0AAX6GJ75_IRIPA|nr:UPF0426 protein, chloroplastic [Iris pallida]